MPSERRRQPSRARHARLLLLLVFLVLRIGDLAFSKFSFWSETPFPFSRGLIVGSVLGTTLLLAVLWQRQVWARYVLIVFNAFVLVVFSLATIVVVNARSAGEHAPLLEVSVGIACYLGATAILVISKRVQRLATTPDSRGWREL